MGNFVHLSPALLKGNLYLAYAMPRGASSSSDSKSNHSPKKPRRNRDSRSRERKPERKKDGSNSPRATASASKSDESKMDKLLAGFGDFSVSIKSEVKSIRKSTEAMQKQINEQNEHFTRELIDVRNVQNDIKRNVDDHGQKIEELIKNQSEATKRIEDALNQHKAAVEESTASVRAASIPPVRSSDVPSNPSPSSGFKRDRRENVLRFNLDGNVSFEKSKLGEFIKERLQSGGLDFSFEIPGKPAQRRFEAVFNGPAANEAVRTLLRYRTTDGDWNKFTIPDVGGEPVRVYYGPDQSPYEAKNERVLKRYCKYLKSVCGDKSFYPRFEESEIFMDGQRLASVEVTQRECKIQWNRPVIEDSTIDKEAAIAQFNKLFNVEWSP